MQTSRAKWNASLRRVLLVFIGCVPGLFAHAPPAFAQTTPDVRESRDEAWWTGPMLANSAETLPPGHFLVEPYFYDVIAGRSHGFGSRAYLLYGLADRLTVGILPVVGYNVPDSGPSSSGIGLGDTTLQAQYRLAEFREGSWFPTIALQVQETFPTGKYDRLGDRPSDGLGGGARSTTLGLNSQTWLWLPNGRILRLRFNVSRAFSGSAGIDGASVYGTGAGFRGRARPGSSSLADASLEYSLTRSWVLALDLTYSHARNTRVTGNHVPDPGSGTGESNVRSDSGPAVAFGFAPAVEYSWTPNLGVLLGIRVIPGNRRTVASVTPALAINFVH